MVNGVERGNWEDSAEFPGIVPAEPRYSWYDEDNDTWYLGADLRTLRDLWDGDANANA